jgi:hypothetical protein
MPTSRSLFFCDIASMQSDITAILSSLNGSATKEPEHNPSSNGAFSVASFSDNSNCRNGTKGTVERQASCHFDPDERTWGDSTRLYSAQVSPERYELRAGSTKTRIFGRSCSVQDMQDLHSLSKIHLTADEDDNINNQKNHSNAKLLPRVA